MLHNKCVCVCVCVRSAVVSDKTSSPSPASSAVHNCPISETFRGKSSQVCFPRCPAPLGRLYIFRSSLMWLAQQRVEPCVNSILLLWVLSSSYCISFSSESDGYKHRCTRVAVSTCSLYLCVWIVCDPTFFLWYYHFSKGAVTPEIHTMKVMHVLAKTWVVEGS